MEKRTASEAMMGNQNARKPHKNIRSKDNLEGFQEGKEFISRIVKEWVEEQEVYIYKPLLEKFLSKI